jgi:PAS domain S-box-containing protein
MASLAPALQGRHQFVWAATLWGLVTLVFTVLLLPGFSPDFRETVSAAGLLVAGLTALTLGLLRVRRSRGKMRRAWLILVVAGFVAITGNVWVAVTGADPITSPSLFGDTTIAVALVLSTLGLLTFPGTRRRGAELSVMFLDGLVAGGAFLLIASVLVYTELLNSSAREGAGAAQLFALIFPLLDVVLATVAVLMLVRASGADRLMLVLVASAYVMYAASDIAFAVQTSKGDFHFGTVLDLGWIVGYLTLGLAASVPAREGLPDAEPTLRGPSDALGTTIVFAILIAAAVVQTLFGRGGELKEAQSALWVVMVTAAGVRQVLLTSDNSRLRRGLEHRVEEQTADLRRLARYNEVLVTSVGDGVYGVDPEGRVTFVNPSAAAALGFTTSELTGRKAHETFHAPGPDGEPFPWSGCYIQEVIQHGGVVVTEDDEYLRADGSVFPVEITASPLLDESEVLGTVVVFRDVTQRREVDRLKNEFLSVVSHELRTPLTSIRGSLGLLAGGQLGELPERAASLVGVAVQNSERLTRLINDLLDIERMDSGVAPMDVMTLEVRELLEAATEQIEGMATSVGVRVELGTASGRVIADEDRVIQALMNLLGNAIKFSESGCVVRLDASLHGSEVHFRVSDDGRGIPPDKLESVFDRFEQVDSSDTRQRGGTGLGLTISKGIVERLGGRIWAESELGVGTTVTFTLPAARELTQPLGDRLGPRSGRPSSSAPAVLVCDDDAYVVEEFSRLLLANGFRPIGVTDGASVLELVRAERPSVVLLDLLMPGATGAQVLEALRGSPDTHDIPVVVISGLGPEADESVARTTDDWLIKPVSEERLVRTVSQVVAHATSGSGQGSGSDAAGDSDGESEATSTGSVLLVEDDADLSVVLGTMLRAAGLEVVHAATASDAVVRGQQAGPDVIVLDMRLPDGSGAHVVKEFQRRGALAQTSLVVYSAADIDEVERHELELGTTVFLNKGRVSPEELRDRVLGLVSAVTSEVHMSPREGERDGTDSDGEDRRASTRTPEVPV